MNKYFIATLIASLIVIVAYGAEQDEQNSNSDLADNAKNSKIVQMPMPELTVANKGVLKAIELKELKTVVKVAGNLAKTEISFTFYNPNERTLQGELNFPLAEGQRVSDIAMEMNGEMRPGVVVEKEKGRVAFEEKVRQKIDPVLVEQTKGNNFKMRVYPLLGEETKTVVISYEEELKNSPEGQLYFLPMNYSEKMDKFELDAIVYNDKAALLGKNNELEDADFSKTEDGFATKIRYENYIANRPFEFYMPSPDRRHSVLTEDHDDGRYFMLSAAIEKNIAAEKALPDRIAIYWDVSGSAEQADKNRALGLLRAYMNHIGNCRADLVPFHIMAEKPEQFFIESGKNDKLIEKINTLRYDGGTQLGALDLSKNDYDEILLISDGLSNFGKSEIITGHTPVYCINTSQSAEHSYLKKVSIETGGAYINLMETEHEQAMAMLKEVTYKFISADYSSADFEEIYPSVPSPIGTDFTMAGKMKTSSGTLKLNFGRGSKVEKTIEVTIDDKDMINSGMLNRIWAHKKIDQLDMNYELNKDEITETGKQFGIVTRNTSLIILETVADYVRYRITPPPSLRGEYDKMIARIDESINKTNSKHEEKVLQMFRDYSKWYDKDFVSNELINGIRASLEGKLPEKEYHYEALEQGPKEYLFGCLSSDSDTLIAGVDGCNSRLIINKENGLVLGRKLSPGKHTLWLSQDGKTWYLKDIEIKADNNTFINLKFDPENLQKYEPPKPRKKEGFQGSSVLTDPNSSTATLRGNVSGGGHEKLMGVTIRVLGTTKGAFSKQDGNYLINDIPPGDYNIVGSMVGLGKDTSLVHLTAGHTTTLDIHLYCDSSVQFHCLKITGNRVVENSRVGTVMTMRSEPIETSNASYSGEYNDALCPNRRSDDDEEEEDAGNTFRGGYGGMVRMSPGASNNGLGMAVRGSRPEDTQIAIDGFQAPERSKKGKISLKAYTSDSAYAGELSDAGDNIYEKYLELKDEYGKNPGFYLDVANIINEAGKKDLALRVLSNIAEMELENHRLLRILAHRLRQLGYYDLAVLMFREVVKLRGEEPQSYRDLSLALAEAGEYQEAADQLYYITTKQWSGRFPQIELIALIELNNMIAMHSGEINVDNYDKRFIKALPVDIRVVVNWDADNCDIDLWVTDPLGEKCMYNHPRTLLGGLMSKDFTGGYGPEQFIIRRALPGKYKVQVHYFGDRQQKMTGATYLQLYFYTNYGTPLQKKQVVTRKVKTIKEHINIGTFEF